MFYFIFLLIIKQVISQCPESTCQFFTGAKPILTRHLDLDGTGATCDTSLYSYQPYHFVHGDWVYYPIIRRDKPFSMIKMNYRQYINNPTDILLGSSDRVLKVSTPLSSSVDRGNDQIYGDGFQIGTRIYGKVDSGFGPYEHYVFEFDMATETERVLEFDGTNRTSMVQIFPDSDGDGNVYYQSRWSSWGFVWKKINPATGVVSNVGTDGCATNQQVWGYDALVSSSAKKIWAGAWYSSQSRDLWICDFSAATSTFDRGAHSGRNGLRPSNFHKYGNTVYFQGYPPHPFNWEIPVASMNVMQDAKTLTMPTGKLPALSGFMPVGFTGADMTVNQMQLARQSNHMGDVSPDGKKNFVLGFVQDPVSAMDAKIQNVVSVWDREANTLQPLIYHTGRGSACHRGSYAPSPYLRMHWHAPTWVTDSLILMSSGGGAYQQDWNPHCKSSGFTVNCAAHDDVLLWYMDFNEHSSPKTKNFYGQPIANDCCTGRSLTQDCSAANDALTTCETLVCACGGHQDVPGSLTRPEEQGVCRVYRSDPLCCRDAPQFCDSMEFKQSQAASYCAKYACANNRCVLSGTLTNVDTTGYDCCLNDSQCQTDSTCRDYSCSVANRTCTHTVAQGPVECCLADLDCDDQFPCTVDQCDPATSECVNRPINVSVSAQTQTLQSTVCSDQNDCSVDSCAADGSTCVHQWPEPVCQLQITFAGGSFIGPAFDNGAGGVTTTTTTTTTMTTDLLVYQVLIPMDQETVQATVSGVTSPGHFSTGTDSVAAPPVGQCMQMTVTVAEPAVGQGPEPAGTSTDFQFNVCRASSDDDEPEEAPTTTMTTGDGGQNVRERVARVE